MSRRVIPVAGLLVATLAILASCGGPKMAAIRHVEKVDLDRFMGDWYVIANIPTSIEEGAHNAVENYQRGEHNEIDTTFTFNDGAFDGEKKEYHPTGYVDDDPSNALWHMQFIWPFKSDYRIIWLDQDYQVTVIGRQARDYVWVMAREPQIPAAQLNDIRIFLADQGYDPALLQMVPQRWP